MLRRLKSSQLAAAGHKESPRNGGQTTGHWCTLLWTLWDHSSLITTPKQPTCELYITYLFDMFSLLTKSNMKGVILATCQNFGTKIMEETRVLNNFSDSIYKRLIKNQETQNFWFFLVKGTFKFQHCFIFPKSKLIPFCPQLIFEVSMFSVKRCDAMWCICCSFVSRLLTGVLTYHLGWVTSAALKHYDGAGPYHQHQVSVNQAKCCHFYTILNYY